MRGQGIGLARWSLAVDELESGRLVPPFPEAAPLPTGLADDRIAPRENLRLPPVAAFRSWGAGGGAGAAHPAR